MLIWCKYFSFICWLFFFFPRTFPFETKALFAWLLTSSLSSRISFSRHSNYRWHSLSPSMFTLNRALSRWTKRAAPSKRLALIVHPWWLQGVFSAGQVVACQTFEQQSLEGALSEIAKVDRGFKVLVFLNPGFRNQSESTIKCIDSKHVTFGHSSKCTEAEGVDTIFFSVSLLLQLLFNILGSSQPM